MSWTFRIDTPLPADDYDAEETTYQWYFDDEPIEGETSDEIDTGGLIDGFLTCDITIRDDEGRPRTRRTVEVYVGDAPPPEPWPEDVEPQTAPFGALTPANSGGFEPIDVTGAAVPLLGIDSLVSGSLDGYTPSILGGRLTFDGTGAPDGAVIRCTYPGGTVDITIDEAAGYASASSIAEVSTILAANHPAGDIAITLRRGRYEGLSARWPDGLHFEDQVVIQGEGNHDTSLDALWPQNCSRITFRNMEVFSDNVPAAHGGSLVRPHARVSQCLFEDLLIHGKHYPIDEPVSGEINTYAGFRCVSTGQGGASFNSTIRNCTIYDVSDAIVITIADDDGFLIEGNVMYNTFTDGIKIASTNINENSDAPRIIRFNVAYDPVGYGTSHNDLMLQWGGNGGKAVKGVQMIMNVSFVTGQSYQSAPQGMTAFTDGPLDAPVLTDPIVCGNVVAVGGNHHLTLGGLDGGIFMHNVLVYPQEGFPNAEAVSPRFFLGPDHLGDRPVIIKNNIQEHENIPSEEEFIVSDNIRLGRFGSVVPYADVFVGEGVSIAQDYAAFIAAFTVKSGDIGGPGTSVGTYGTPGDASSWSFNENVLD